MESINQVTTLTENQVTNLTENQAVFLKEQLASYLNQGSEAIKAQSDLVFSAFKQIAKTYGPELNYAVASTALVALLGGGPGAAIVSAIVLPMLIPTITDKGIQVIEDTVKPKEKTEENQKEQQEKVQEKAQASFKEFTGWHLSQVIRVHGRKAIGAVLGAALQGLGVPGVVAKVALEVLVTPWVRDEVLAPAGKKMAEVAFDKTEELIGDFQKKGEIEQQAS